ncbi:MAG: LemA family protein [Clostridia bacterium]|nr:LemA family protein [Clostridia bacterium]
MKSKTKKYVIIGAIAVVVILLASIIGGYNSLVNLEADVQESYANIETQLQRRYDLIPNLVSTVKGYAAHEEEVYTALANARAALGSAQNAQQAADANAALDSALSRLLVIVENYPELKASENFKALQYELSGTENRISTERTRYNENVKEYNTAIRRFPKSLIASVFGFEKAASFEATSGAENAPIVSFDD